ncbi:cation diffusion facilitator family transporter [Acidithiobacillus sp.]|uniref:cation diffusion facilitator family transporter n=1 Tax=Acidithiobacillus sp. TaxID=1872118 RepID=UPI0026065424|nr:cation diffusion facilitator family transporter [Acidithiobacillus sp.]
MATMEAMDIPEKITSSDLAEQQKSRWMMASTGLNGLLSIAKIGWGVYSGSTVVIADAVHSISDVLGALLILAAIHFSRHRSLRFPYGLHKVEDMAALGGAMLVVVAAYEIARAVFFSGGARPPYNPLATMGFMTAILVAEGIFYVFERRAATRLHSPGLQSDVVNWLGDIGAGVVVIAGIGGHLLRIPFAQEVAVLIILLLILEGTWGVLKNAILSLLDASVESELYAKAKNVLLTTPEVEGVEGLRLRHAGSVLFADATIGIAAANFAHAHEVADRAQQRLQEAFPELENITLHYEPPFKPFKRRAFLLIEGSALATRFGMAQRIRFEDQNREGILVNTQTLNNPVPGAEKGRGIRLAAWLIAQGADEIHMRAGQLEPALEALLSAAGVTLVIDENPPLPPHAG